MNVKIVVRTLLLFTQGILGVVSLGIAGTQENWPTYGGDYENTRFSELTEITTKNVKHLEVKWSFRTGLGRDDFVGFYMSPIVVDGTMYISDPGHFRSLEQNVFSLDAKTGQLNWHRAITLSSVRDLEYHASRPNKGVAYGNDTVYMATFDARLWALDAATGTPVATFSDLPGHEGFVQVGDPDAGYFLTAAPVFIPAELIPAGGPASGHDLVVIGISGGEIAARGYLSAFDAETGDLLWRFFTVPAPGEFGGDTWPTNAGTPFANPFTRGGATVWMPPAYDPHTGFLIFGTGNAGVDLDGTHRAGDNLFAASIVAVNAATGKRVWHFQQVHHDIWDYDQPSVPVLFDMKYKGKTRRVVGAAGKTGWYYILNRRTGKPIHPCPETPVPTFTDVVAPDGSVEQPSPTQPVCTSDAFVPQGDRILPTTGKYIEPIFTPPRLPVPGRVTPAFFPVFPLAPASDAWVEPGVIGGSEWSPLAHNPALGLTFIPANIMPSLLTVFPEAAPTTGQFNVGGHWSYGTLEEVAMEASGVLVAMKPKTGKIHWKRPSDSLLFGGVCATAGDLVFMGEGIKSTTDPTQVSWYFTAFNARNGKRMWRWPVPDNIGVNAPCVSYAVDGRQYIAVAIGGLAQRGLVLGGNGDYIYAFGLP